MGSPLEQRAFGDRKRIRKSDKTKHKDKKIRQ
jgi:hypothetical protein